MITEEPVHSKASGPHRGHISVGAYCTPQVAAPFIIGNIPIQPEVLRAKAESLSDSE